MKKLYQSMVILLASSATYPLMASESAPSAAVSSISTATVRFEQVAIENQNGSYIVSGKIKRAVYNSHVSDGHIDFAAYGAAGDILAEGAVSYSPSLVLRRWKYGSSFSIQMPESVGNIAKVQVTFHENQSDSGEYHSMPVTHSQNVLIGN